MFLNIRVLPEDEPFLRFLWEPDHKGPVKVVQFRAHLFGKADSSYVSVEVITHTARTYIAEFPNAAFTILSSFLMDDLSDSRPTPEQAIQLYHEVVELLKSKCKLHIRKFQSSSKEVQDHIPDDMRCLASKKLVLQDEKATSTLGLITCQNPTF